MLTQGQIIFLQSQGVVLLHVYGGDSDSKFKHLHVWISSLITPIPSGKIKPSLLIHEADHSSGGTITIFTQSVGPSLRPFIPKLQNHATITAGWDCGLGEWIIDDSCLVKVYLTNFMIQQAPSLELTHQSPTE